MRSVAWLLLCFVAVDALGQDCAPVAMKRASARVEYDQSASGTARSTAIFFEPADTGALRARDEATGRALWTFFPPELGQARGSGDLMTSIAVLRFDVNADGVIDTASGDRVWLYFGLKRGGPWYYALDVTGRAPRVLWKAGSSQLDGLGEAWSTPTITRVRIAGARQDAQHFVVIIGGGLSRDSSATGNRILMLDAATGRLLWSAGNHAGADRPLSHMGHGIAARIAVLDTDGDELADRMYAADIGGQIWRFDIWNGRDRSELVTGGVLANLGAQEPRPTPATAADARRFFNAPDVAFIQPRGGNAYYNLAIGSGGGGSATATPVTDRFYSIRDRQPFTRRAQSEYNALQPMLDSDLMDITTSPVGFRVPDYALGWRLDLASGEEALAESLTANGVILFTTFEAAASFDAAGRTANGATRVYAVRADNGTAAVDLNRDRVVTPEDRSSLLVQAGSITCPAVSSLLRAPDSREGGVDVERCVVSRAAASSLLTSLELLTIDVQAFANLLRELNDRRPCPDLALNAPQGNRERRAPLGIVVGTDGAAMSAHNRPCDREADSKAVRFRRDKWCKQRAEDIRGQTRASVTYEDFDIGGADFASYRQVTSGWRHLGHRV